MSTMTYDRIDHSLTMAQETGHGKVVMALGSCCELEAAHLYLVTISRKMVERYPVVTMHYVLACDEAAAISQVEENAFPEERSYVDMATRKECLTSTAVQIPLHIRGWGRQTF